MGLIEIGLPNPSLFICHAIPWNNETYWDASAIAWLNVWFLLALSLPKVSSTNPSALIMILIIYYLKT